MEALKVIIEFNVVEKVWYQYSFFQDVYKFEFELWKGGAGDKMELEEIPKIKKEIPILNGLHVEPNFLKGVLKWRVVWWKNWSAI